MSSFAGFDPYKLIGVRVTDRVLGRGSYATVLELEYMGLKCAGKKIYQLSLRRRDASDIIRRFENECHLLSRVRHPNIVQFLGVCFQEGVQAPILVMEFLPTNLTSCIKKYCILPKEISYSILYEVSLGLFYLHSQIPPIIHRDLTSNNVLLTHNMTAKISDLGMAGIIDLNPVQVSCMTPTLGTLAFMPPEVIVANPKYNTSIDVFSLGVLMIHVFSGKWPEPQLGQIHAKPDGELIAVTEAERRGVFLRAIGDDHPLIDLIRNCIDNYPPLRPPSSEIRERLAEMVLRFPASFANKVEVLRKIEELEDGVRAHTAEALQSHHKDEMHQAPIAVAMISYDEDHETTYQRTGTLLAPSESESVVHMKAKNLVSHGADTQPSSERGSVEQLVYNSSMSEEDFCRWLRSRGISEKDCKALSGNGVTPSGFIQLNAEDFDDTGLTKIGKKLILKILAEVVCAPP